MIVVVTQHVDIDDLLLLAFFTSKRRGIHFHWDPCFLEPEHVSKRWSG
jgi:hypothetical protein